jgi:predicted transcriptional regulator
MVAAKRLYAEKIRVRDVMSQPVVIIRQNKPRKIVSRMMLPRSTKKLPFLEGRTAGTVIGLLSKPKLVVKAKEEQRRQMEDKVYMSPLPPDLKPPLDQLKKEDH